MDLLVAQRTKVERPSVSRVLETPLRLNKPGQRMQSARGFFIVHKRAFQGVDSPMLLC